jgi:O-6-methylguanine DNA methyltransferase
MHTQKEIEHRIIDGLGDESDGDEEDKLTIALDAIYASGPSRARTMRVQKALQKALEGMHSRDVFYGRMRGSPIGSILIGVSEKGVVAIHIGNSEEKFISQLERRFKACVLHSQERIAEVVRQLHEYFAGQRSAFELELFLDDLTPFQRQVLLTTLEIPHGQITNYGEIARQLGKAHAARAVGQALARNPLPIVIPCHRVLGADGSLHGYTAGRGLETKVKLLELEGLNPRL